LQLSVGQNVVHPNHGIGEVVNVKKMDVVEGFNRYYVIKFLTNNLTSHIPIRKTDDVGLRKTMSETKIERVFETLRATPSELPDHYKQRRKRIEDLFKSGRPVKIAQAVRDLAWRKKSDGLSKADGQFLSKGKNMLVEEISLVTDKTDSETRRDINKVLAKAAKEIGVEA